MLAAPANRRRARPPISRHNAPTRRASKHGDPWRRGCTSLQGHPDALCACETDVLLAPYREVATTCNTVGHVIRRCRYVARAEFVRVSPVAYQSIVCYLCRPQAARALTTSLNLDISGRPACLLLSWTRPSGKGSAQLAGLSAGTSIWLHLGPSLAVPWPLPDEDVPRPAKLLRFHVGTVRQLLAMPSLITSLNNTLGDHSRTARQIP
jgi:hypothetical protein